MEAWSCVWQEGWSLILRLLPCQNILLGKRSVQCIIYPLPVQCFVLRSPRISFFMVFWCKEQSCLSWNCSYKANMGETNMFIYLFSFLQLHKGTAGGLWDSAARSCTSKGFCFSMSSWKFLGWKCILPNLPGEKYCTSQVQRPSGETWAHVIRWWRSHRSILNPLLSGHAEGAGCLYQILNSANLSSGWWKRMAALVTQCAFFREISGWPVGTVPLVFSRMFVSCK